MHHDQLPARVSDARAMPRSNMYIVALLSWGEGSSEARIRNLSAAGALVEAVTIPPADSLISLVRGSLQAEGSVAWTGHGRCGIQFKSSVSVVEWMAPTRNSEQKRIDETVATLKAGALPLREAQRHRSREMISISEQLASDLGEVSHLLEVLGAEMARDAIILGEYGGKLQTFDIAAQTLEVAAALLRNKFEPGSDAAARLQNLRASRRQAK